MHLSLDISCATDVSVEGVSSSSIAFSWSTSRPDSSFRITVCVLGSSTCTQEICTDCNSYNATNLMPNIEYNITVDSFSTLLAGDCFSRTCSSNTGMAATCECGCDAIVCERFTYVPLRDEGKGLLLCVCYILLYVT